MNPNSEGSETASGRDLDSLLDEALAQSFPASDPPAVFRREAAAA